MEAKNDAVILRYCVHVILATVFSVLLVFVQVVVEQNELMEIFVVEEEGMMVVVVVVCAAALDIRATLERRTGGS